MQPDIVHTADGSTTLRWPSTGETYHSLAGAVQESEYVYMQQGLQYYCRQNVSPALRILEIGFGTGLNALLTYNYQQKGQCLDGVAVSYEAVELYPVEAPLWHSMNYAKTPEQQCFFSFLHQSPWDTPVSDGALFSLYKRCVDALVWQPAGTYDVVFFDAFSPHTQASLWQETLLKRIADALHPGSVLTTYSASGLVKQGLRQSGFTVQRLPGFAGKHHMVRAIF